VSFVFDVAPALAAESLDNSDDETDPANCPA
jgi:hypothetical protein